MALLLGALASLLVWFAIAQYVRYALPIIAILCALGATAYALLWRRSGATSKPGFSALPLVLAAAGLIAYLNTVLVYPGLVPYRVVLGQQTKADYLADRIAPYSALQLLNQEPNATGAWTAGGYARLYSQVRLGEGVLVPPAGTTNTADLFAALDWNGYSHIIIDRNSLYPGWDASIYLDEEELRRNTILVGGDHNAYLYRIVPPDQRGHDQSWARGRELLPNTGFEEIDDGVPRDWNFKGSSIKDATEAGYQTPGNAVLLRDGSSLRTAVRVVPGAQYLLSHATKSTGEYGLARLQINWYTESGEPDGVSIDVVPTSPLGYHRFSLLATAPPDARLATVILQTHFGQALFDDISLKSVEEDPRPTN